MKTISLFGFIVNVILIFITFNSTIAQNTLILQPDSIDGKDAHISSYFSNTNKGSHRGIHSLGWTVNGNVTIGRSFFQFNLTSIPIGSTIINAELSLFNDPGNNIVLTNGQHSNSTASNTSFISRVIGPWDEFTLTWNNQPSFTTINQATLAQSTNPNQDYTNINVTDMVQHMVDFPSQNNGFVLRLANEIHYCALIFGSSDNPDPLKHPKLEITYSSPVGIESMNDDRPDLLFHPNPTLDGRITLDLENWNLISKFVVTNLLGEEFIPEIEYHTGFVKLNLSGPAGIYYINVYNSDGVNRSTKLIKL